MTTATTSPDPASPPATPGESRQGATTPSAKATKRNWRALLLVGPSLLLLAVVIGYPIVRAVYLSFQANRHLDKETGMFLSLIHI